MSCRPRCAGIAAVAALLLGLAAVPAQAYPRPGVTQRVSMGVGGAQPDNYSAYPSLSADGRFVAFDSQAANLVPDDSNGGVNDIFVVDRRTGTTVLASADSHGQGSDEPAYLARIDGSGQYVIFQTHGELVPGAPGVGSVYLRNLATGTTELVSVDSDGRPADNLSFPGDLTPGGRFVAFESFANNLVADDTNNKNDVFVRDRFSKTTQRVSLRADGRERVGDSFSPAISDDGRYVAYVALVGTQGEDRSDFIDEMQVFWHDRVTGEVRLVSTSSEGHRGNAFSSAPAISADGRYVAFASDAQNLVPADANRTRDIFVHDVVTRTTERVNTDSAGREANGRSTAFALSDDARYVAFKSAAPNLVAADSNGRDDIFVRDRHAGTTERVSVGSGGEQAGTHSESPFISADGRFVAFSSYSDALIPSDSNGARDIFVRDRGPALGAFAVVSEPVPGGVEVSGLASASGVPLATRLDQAGDAVQGGRELGGDLTAATVLLRPEEEDLLVRLRLDQLPGVRPPQASGLAIGCALSLTCGVGIAGAPAVLYTLELSVGQVRFEVRAERAAAPAAPLFSLYRCDAACLPQAELAGSLGVTGNELVVAVPLTEVGTTPQTPVTQLRAVTAVGGTGVGSGALLDDVRLPDATIATLDAALAVGPASVPPPASSFTPAGSLAGGRFRAALPTPGPGGAAWVRVCLAGSCTLTGPA